MSTIGANGQHSLRSRSPLPAWPRAQLFLPLLDRRPCAAAGPSRTAGHPEGPRIRSPDSLWAASRRSSLVGCLSTAAPPCGGFRPALPAAPRTRTGSAEGRAGAGGAPHSGTCAPAQPSRRGAGRGGGARRRGAGRSGAPCPPAAVPPLLLPGRASSAAVLHRSGRRSARAALPGPRGLLLRAQAGEFRTRALLRARRGSLRGDGGGHPGPGGTAGRAVPVAEHLPRRRLDRGGETAGGVGGGCPSCPAAAGLQAALRAAGGDPGGRWDPWGAAEVWGSLPAPFPSGLGSPRRKGGNVPASTSSGNVRAGREWPGVRLVSKVSLPLKMEALFATGRSKVLQ